MPFSTWMPRKNNRAPNFYIVENIMSDNTPGPEFWDRSNAVIKLLNDQCQTAPPNDVGASILFASARFNTFNFAKAAGSSEALAFDRERALEYFTTEFRNMMSSNLDDFIANFDKFLKPDAQ
jgi:hypothetical protein